MGIRKNLVLTGEELISQPAVDDVLGLFDKGPRVKAEAIFQDNKDSCPKGSTHHRYLPGSD